MLLPQTIHDRQQVVSNFSKDIEDFFLLKTNAKGSRLFYDTGAR